MRGRRVVLAVLVGLAGGVASLAACGEGMDPVEPVDLVAEPGAGLTREALCEYGARCGKYDSQASCEREMSEWRSSVEPEVIYEWTMAGWQRDCTPDTGVGGACRAPRWNAKFLWTDCQGGLFCYARPGEAGTCEPWLEEGAPCGTSLACAPGLYCAELFPTGPRRGHCARRPGPGEACGDDGFRTCAQGLICSNESGRCEPWSAE